QRPVPGQGPLRHRARLRRQLRHLRRREVSGADHRGESGAPLGDFRAQPPLASHAGSVHARTPHPRAHARARLSRARRVGARLRSGRPSRRAARSPRTRCATRTPLGPHPPLACSAANVPGCLPGYVAKTDEWGRLVYTRDPEYAPPLARDAPVSLAIAHSQVVMPAELASWSEPMAAPTLHVARPGRVQGSRGHFALVFMPGISTFPTYTRLSEGKAEGQVAIELRGSQGGGRLRLAGGYTSC